MSANIVSTTSEQEREREEEDDKITASPTFHAPPDVAITPCQPWPPPYYIEEGLRKVTPYHWTYNTHCKGRWRNREILDIFQSEFRDRPSEYYKHSIENGSIALNGKTCSPETIVKNGDVISHTIHRHEPPVSPSPVGIVYEDESLIVINKPAGVPVHPAGRYNFNSVIEILRAERGYAFNPRPAHRLDRLTSGIMFIGKTQKRADEISNRIKSRTMKKEYIARVIGEFPEGDVVCEKPILQISPKLGLNRVRATGKSARTVFKRMAYYPVNSRQTPSMESDGVATTIEGIATTSSTDPSLQATSDTTGDVSKKLPWKNLEGYSIVRCLPLTGRTHQIRVHLQFLGHPISNDPIYSNRRVFGQSLGENDEGADHDEDIISRLSRMGKDEVAEAVAYHDELVEEWTKRRAERMTGEVCSICSTELYSDPGDHELGIYLHAKRYACDNGEWSYETPLPAWALPPAGHVGPVEATAESDPLSLDLENLGLVEVEESKESKEMMAEDGVDEETVEASSVAAGS